jgi:integral membrane protein
MSALQRYIPPFEFKDSFGIFRVVAFFEGSSYLLLLVTMVLKYGFNMPEPNMVVGMAHGVLFIAYVIMLVLAAREMKWTLLQMLFFFILSLVPFGTFYGEGHVWGEYATKE